MKVLAFAGGVGGAKLADGLAQALNPGDLTVVVNTGDDFEHLGLRICPDLDTVCYTLAGIANPATGWGRAGETWNALESLAELGGPTWFRLGDRDLGTHLERTKLLQEGQALSSITRRFCQAWGVRHTVLPMSDDPVRTMVISDEGELEFQDYFVRRQYRPHVRGFYFNGLKDSHPAPGVLEAIAESSLVVFCPSNPWVSIDPILSVPGIRSALKSNLEKSKPVIAVSPIIGGQAVKGPAAQMYEELGMQPSALAVARHYGSSQAGGLLTSFVLDRIDSEQEASLSEFGVRTLVTDTIMHTAEDRRRLALDILQFWEIPV